MSEDQTTRRAEIEAAAFKVLERVGYKKASMLQIAKEAKASNETLYAWYGNKQSLFQSLIVANAGAVEEALESTFTGDSDDLFALGKLVLGFTATQKAIIINRAAVADVQETGLLSQAIETHARQAMLRCIKAQLAGMEASGKFTFEHGVAVATEVYVSLLIGELQMQQSLGSVPALSQDEIEARSRRASSLFGKLFEN
ncbi:TetR/AcrR family transcriptional regulator [Marivita hallyeonensis]|uniref:Transcriptional regulator, TetR family n=1 Tax=Marivita hallyeonensis TaxID=996342 RepID=A0A1M5XKI4_9RHOB|nr:TetR/AcrR family transcriptional regulator [Marivita hallyeonensis]SHI00357.1 transcriptional regulator, TetR family [Marivita hallyeonensis]